MTGAKVQHLETMLINQKMGNLWKFDYSQIGDSKGDLTFENWFADAESVLDRAFDEEQQPLTLVASSMGAFISLNLARRSKNEHKIRALFLCAPARDFMRLNMPMMDQIPGDFVPIPGFLDCYRWVAAVFR